MDIDLACQVASSGLKFSESATDVKKNSINYFSNIIIINIKKNGIFNSTQ